MSYPSPRYFVDEGEVSATFRTFDAEPELTIGGASRVSLLSTGESTGGLYGLYRWDMLPGKPKPAASGGHYHRTFSEIRDEGRTLTSEEWTELYARHDQSMA